MVDGLGSKRMMRLFDSTRPFLDFFTDPAFSARNEDPLSCDFAVGNPHEMPLPGFVDALQRWAVPQNKDWFAYKLSEPESQRAVVDSLREWRGIEYAPEDVHLTNGAFGALAVSINTLVDSGDEVIYISPPWFFYEPLILAAGGVPVRVRIDEHTFDLDLDVIVRALTPRTRAIIVNSPNNPTGRIYPDQTLRDLGDALLAASNRWGHPIYLLSDESYSRIVFDGKPFLSPTRYYPYSLLIYTYGKTLLTPGQRIGYIALNPEMPDKEMLRQGLFLAQVVTAYAFPNALLQHALRDLNALSIDVQHLERRRDFMVGALQEIGYEVHRPEGTFYLLPRSPIEDDVSFAKVLNSKKIYTLPGKVVEMPGYFRISLTANDDMVNRSLPGFAGAFEEARQGVPVRAARPR